MQADHSHPLDGWIPFKLTILDEIPLVHWLYVSGSSFNDPFFDETISSCKSHEYNSSRYKCVSSLESMIEWSEEFPEKNPVAFIFHISRCGSTLLSQLIGLDEKYTVLSEVPFFDEILRLPYKLNTVDDAFRKKILQAGIRLVGKNEGNKKQHVFIKTDSWHIFFYEIFRQLYPSIPFVLLYRSPDEVLLSHQKFRGMQAVQGILEPEIFGFAEEKILQLSIDEYAADVLEKYLLAFEEIAKKDPLTLLLDYKKGVENMMEKSAAHLKISWEKEHLLKMKERSGFHSKFPQQNFKEEPVKKEMPEYLKNAMRVYERLGR